MNIKFICVSGHVIDKQDLSSYDYNEKKSKYHHVSASKVALHFGIPIKHCKFEHDEFRLPMYNLSTHVILRPQSDGVYDLARGETDILLKCVKCFLATNNHCECKSCYFRYWLKIRKFFGFSNKWL
jgi:hypothetical protein